MKYRVTLLYDVEFSDAPSNVGDALWDALQLLHDVDEVVVVSSADWEANVVLKSKTVGKV
jgi:hypothetical protein